MEEFENPNIYQPDGDFSKYDVRDEDSLQIRCPHCQSVGTFQSPLNHYLSFTKNISASSRSRFGSVNSFVLTCPNPKCRGVVFAVQSFIGDKDSIVCHPPELLDFDSTSLPLALVDTLKEAVVCHSQGAFRASAMMVRRLLEELCQDCGVEGKSLHVRLKALRAQISLPDDLFDAMDELKALGNDAAHIEAKAFAKIDAEESELSIELAQEILKARYQHKNLVDRLRARKTKS